MKKIGLSGTSNWDMEAFFQSIKVLENVVPGLLYIQHEPFALNKNSDFVEMISFEYDPEKISLNDILNIHFSTFIPTVNSFDEDSFFPRCRCIITYNDSEEKFEIDKFILRLEEKYQTTNEKVYVKTVSFQTLKNKFVELTKNERNLYAKDKENSYARSRIIPKLEKIEKAFPQYYSEVPSMNPDGTLKE